MSAGKQCNKSGILCKVCLLCRQASHSSRSQPGRSIAGDRFDEAESVVSYSTAFTSASRWAMHCFCFLLVHFTLQALSCLKTFNYDLLLLFTVSQGVQKTERNGKPSMSVKRDVYVLE